MRSSELFVSVAFLIITELGSVWCGVMTMTTFRRVLDRKVAENSCQKVHESADEAVKAKCAATCDLNTPCRGFTLTCPDLHPNLDPDADLDTLLSVCQCLACYTEQIPRNVATPAPPDHSVECPPPLLINRTTVTRTKTGPADTAHYSCSVSTDVHVSGTTDVTCLPDGQWPTVTILCAPTDCWYTHALFGPVYAGTLSVTADGHPCQSWRLNVPQDKNPFYDNDTWYPSDNWDRSNANDHCRIFEENFDHVWCYWNETYTLIRKYSNCDVSHCDPVPGVLL